MKAMRGRWFAAVVAVLAVSSLVAMADWEPGMPSKWVQLPDLTPNGMDVNATYQLGGTGQPTPPFIKVLADDFLCRETGPITSIHIWGSWLGDIVNPNTFFKLSIHDDVPAGVDAPYSHPVPIPRWQQEFVPGQYIMRPYASGQEMFYEPNTDTIIGSDTVCFQYNFPIVNDPFIQQGTSTSPIVYWLDVQAFVPGTEVFGWKTSPDDWNDDAVFADTDALGNLIGPMPPPVYWKDMTYPAGHPYGDDTSINLAFVIVPEPGIGSLLLGSGLVCLIVRRLRRWRG